MSSVKRKTTGKTSTKKRKTKRKSSVYIPPYKAIILCLSIIIVCLVLLLINTVSKNSYKPEPEQASPITERFETEETKPQIPERTPKLKQDEAKPAPETKTEPKQPQTKQPEVKQTKPQEEKKPAPKKSDFGFAKASKNAQLCFVFDDGGQNNAQLKEFLKLPFPITVAVLPQITHSVEAADLVRKSGNEVILHQPMQSINESINPGPGAITPDMSDEQIVSQLFVNINQIGPIAGMNNHEGSGITADAEKMAVVLQMASENGIYFLDSRTNVETKVPYVAKELGYSYYERNIFLDNEKTRENALNELKKGLTIANKNGSVIMIGHIWSADFLPQLLKEVYPELKQKGYTFSVVSKSNALKR